MSGMYINGQLLQSNATTPKDNSFFSHEIKKNCHYLRSQPGMATCYLTTNPLCSSTAMLQMLLPLCPSTVSRQWP